MLDSVIEASQESLPIIALPDHLTVGGSPANDFHSNIAISYRGCLRDLIINNQ